MAMDEVAKKESRDQTGFIVSVLGHMSAGSVFFGMMIAAGGTKDTGEIVAWLILLAATILSFVLSNTEDGLERHYDRSLRAVEQRYKEELRQGLDNAYKAAEVARNKAVANASQLAHDSFVQEDLTPLGKALEYETTQVNILEAALMGIDRLRPDDINRIRNSDVRQRVIEAYGVDRFFGGLRNATIAVVDERTAFNGVKEMLVLVESIVGLSAAQLGPKYRDHLRNPTGRRVELYLVCSCPSTGRTYFLLVPNNIRLVSDAQEWLRSDEHALKGIPALPRASVLLAET